MTCCSICVRPLHHSTSSLWRRSSCVCSAQWNPLCACTSYTQITLYNLSFLKKWLVTKVVVFYLLFACLLILDTEDHIWDVQITKMAYQPVQSSSSSQKLFFFYLIQLKGRQDKSFKLRFNFYHLHATISTRLFFSLTKLLMMISYLITFPFFRKCAGNYFRWCTAVWEQHTMPMRRCLWKHSQSSSS